MYVYHHPSTSARPPPATVVNAALAENAAKRRSET